MEPKGGVAEIGPDLYRLSIYAPEFDLQFNHFLIDDEQRSAPTCSTRWATSSRSPRRMSSDAPRRP